MALSKKPVNGMKDILPEEMQIRDYVQQVIKETYRSFGFTPIETPCMENIANLSNKQGGENEKLIFKVMKRGEKLKVAEAKEEADLVDFGMRYDLTVPLVRFYSNNANDLPSPFKAIQMGNVWRADRPQRGRYRQFMQCDIDILVHESEVDRIADLLVSEMKYKKEEKSPHDISLYSGGGVHLELHYNLIEDGCIGDMKSVLRSVWDRASAVDGTSEFTLSDEMFYYYHIAHMAKHFVSTGGCGIRPFVDIWVLNHRISFDRERRNALLSEGGLRTFAKEAEALSEVWFGDGEHTDVTQQMQNYVLCGGVYGTTENRVAVQQVKRGGKFRYALSRIWLPYDTLKFHYPSLDGKRALLPFYEMRRWCKLIFCGGAKRGMNELRHKS